MLLTITYSGQNTTDLGFLLYKNPYRPQMFELSYGKAYVFYPEISNTRTTTALLLDINSIDLARGKVGSKTGGLFDYVNDRPYVSSSFMSTAISKVFGTAMTGRADAHQKLSDSSLELTARITMLPCRGEQEKLYSVFEHLGYEVNHETFTSDENFPTWGDSQYVNLTISSKIRLRDLLKHIYVLIPVFDRQKHYWIGEDEVEKLLRLGENWLSDHPEKEYITRRYLNRHRSLVSMAFEQLAAANIVDGEILDAEPEAPLDRQEIQASEPATQTDGLKNLAAQPDTLTTKPGALISGTEVSVGEQEGREEKPDKKMNLNKQRLGSVVAALKSCGAKRVIDIGCGEGNLLRFLVKERQFTHIAGVDVSHVALKRAEGKLKLNRAGDSMRERLQLFQGSLIYKDERFAGYDAACVIEVIEHLDIPRLAAFERVLFEFAKPTMVVLTTPNKEYNTNYGFLGEDDLRHNDHRFEYTRVEFRTWATGVAEKYSYDVRFSEIGDADATLGAPTQMGVFTLCR